MTASATVGVLGPGAVGGVLAVGLVRSGVRVVCIARPDTAALIASPVVHSRGCQRSCTRRCPAGSPKLTFPATVTCGNNNGNGGTLDYSPH